MLEHAVDNLEIAKTVVGPPLAIRKLPVALATTNRDCSKVLNDPNITLIVRSAGVCDQINGNYV